MRTSWTIFWLSHTWLIYFGQQMRLANLRHSHCVSTTRLSAQLICLYKLGKHSDLSVHIDGLGCAKTVSDETSLLWWLELTVTSSHHSVNRKPLDEFFNWWESPWIICMLSIPNEVRRLFMSTRVTVCLRPIKYFGQSCIPPGAFLNRPPFQWIAVNRVQTSAPNKLLRSSSDSADGMMGFILSAI